MVGAICAHSSSKPRTPCTLPHTPPQWQYGMETVSIVVCRLKIIFQSYQSFKAREREGGREEIMDRGKKGGREGGREGGRKEGRVEVGGRRGA